MLCVVARRYHCRLRMELLLHYPPSMGTVLAIPVTQAAMVRVQRNTIRRLLLGWQWLLLRGRKQLERKFIIRGHFTISGLFM